jgi:hypothetical protein
MPYYTLAQGVSYGLVDGEPIFLDLGTDRYFQVDELLRSDLDRLRRSGGILPETAAARLLASGIIRQSASRKPAGPAPTFIPNASLLDKGCSSAASLRDAAEIGSNLLRARLAVRWLPLRRIIERLAPPAGSKPRDVQRVHAMAKRFEAARRRVPLDRHCLTDSIALLQFLHRRSLTASLLFGVKLHPFAAHCWLQDKRKVFNDDAETVQGFTPVMVL